MPERSPMHQQIDTLPALVRAIAGPFDSPARATFDFELRAPVKRRRRTWLPSARGALSG